MMMLTTLTLLTVTHEHPFYKAEWGVSARSPVSDTG